MNKTCAFPEPQNQWSSRPFHEIADMVTSLESTKDESANPDDTKSDYLKIWLHAAGRRGMPRTRNHLNG